MHQRELADIHEHIKFVGKCVSVDQMYVMCTYAGL